MNTAASHIGESGGESAALRSVAKQPSKLFASLFRPQDAQHRLTILEIGTALPETVDFFSRYKCRIHFLDLLSEPLVQNLHQVNDQKDMQQQFERLLTFPQGTKFDICLFWDLLCYLDDRALRAFNAALRPYLHHGSRTHGFGIHHLGIKLNNRRYGVIDDSTLSVRPSRLVQPETYPHSQVEMHEMLSCFDFERGLMLPDGKLEILLKAREAALLD